MKRKTQNVETGNTLLNKRVENAPDMPGVYMMKDVRQNVIYVGKAKSIRKRIRTYFGGRDARVMIPFLLSRVHDLEFIITDTEKEALILENTLIKKYRPRYNVNLRDDKNYFSIRINLREKFPRFQFVRSIKKDGATYFGPYASSAAVKETLHFLHQIFPLRTCKDPVFNTRKRPCIEFEIHRCLAPCCDLVGSESYTKLVKEAVLFMEGHGKKLLAELKRQMMAASDALNFEEASMIRDRIQAIEETLEKQRVVSLTFKDQDVFGFYRSGNYIQLLLLNIRRGCIIGQRKFSPVITGADSSEALSSLLKQYYDGEVFVPEEIVVPEHIEDVTVIKEWLSEKREGRRVSVIVPKRGEKLKLLDIAASNAEHIFKMEGDHTADEEMVLHTLTERLHLRSVPHRIECFDVSNIGGTYAVGSMVSFVDGIPDTSSYRRFRIKSVRGADDYAMMYEVLMRRFREKRDLPDLVVVDGGKGQLNVALSVFRDAGIDSVDVVALAKEHHEGEPPSVSERGRPGIDKKADRVYLPGRKNPLFLGRSPSALYLLQRVRDEAHRFAVSYHRTVKKRADFRSLLDDVPGIGTSRKKILLSYFRGVDKIATASIRELEGVPGIGKKMAGIIFRHFHNE